MSDKPASLAFICCKPEKIKPDLPPVILHHGFMNSKERWRPVQQDLADSSGRIVYAIDARNHGESEQRDGFYINVLAEDLKHFMDVQNIPRACLIGHSMGGLVVMILALTEPDRVEKLIIEDMSPKDPEVELCYVYGDMIEEQLKCFEQSTNADTEGSMQQKLRECMFRNIPFLPDVDQEIIQKMKFRIKKTANGYEPQANLEALLKAVRNPPISHFPVDGQFNKDTLFLCGGKSILNIADEKELILKYFPKAKLSEFEDAGHDVCLYDPKRFAEEISKFL